MPNNKSKTSKSKSKVFIVEEVLDKRIKSGRVEYLLKWEGYEE